MINELLSLEDILNAAHDATPLRGIYFLIGENDELLYVGKTIDIFARIYVHRKSNKRFSKFTFCHIPDGDLGEIERAYIDKFDPPLNIQKKLPPQPPDVEALRRAVNIAFGHERLSDTA